MFLGFLALFTGLAISAVAIYYSVLGLAAIFAAAVIPIIVMGVVLETSKLVAAWWLKWNWHRAPAFIKYYLLAAILTLMLITSMGIFGFLSKAHSDQAIPTGDAVAQIEIIDQFIESEQQRIADARSTLELLDNQIREFTDRGFVTRGVNARAEQQQERDFLNQEITSAQARIAELRQERAPAAASLRALEAEVGPIRYIAQLIYGQDPGPALLERAVVWVIIVIVLVFDPLAVLLLLSAQMSFVWHFQRTGKSSRWLPPTADSGNTPPPQEPPPAPPTQPTPLATKPSKNKTIELNQKLQSQSVDIKANNSGLEVKSLVFPSTSAITPATVEIPDSPTDQEIAEALDQIYDETLIEPVDEQQVKRIKDLVKGVEVDLEKPLEEKHHIFEDDIKAAREAVKKKK